ncbi:MAG: DUF86 domain-containing protein [Chthoniobacterales bacterium]|nr:DUF86 domain-containing protein [Chthoniobacterales bacterium]
MSGRDLSLTLRQIVEFADEVAALIESRGRNDLETNGEFRRALERCIELIGEAATRLPEEWRASQPEIPWREIIAMRKVLIHGYDVVIAEVFVGRGAKGCGRSANGNQPLSRVEHY